MLEPTDVDFFRRAEIEAERHVREWIRKTFRGAFLQGFQRRLVLDSRDPLSSGPVVQLESLEECLNIVKQVRDGWGFHLRKHRHFKVADWVEETFASGKEHLWSIALTKEGFQEYLNDKKKPKDGDLPKEAAAATTTAVDHAHLDDEASETTVQLATNEMPPLVSSSTGLLRIPYCELRRLGRPTTVEQAPRKISQADVIAHLQTMGKEGVSEWPLDHAKVDQFVQETSKRRRAERSKDTDDSSSSLTNQVQVVLSKSSNQTETDDNEDSQRLLSQVVAKSRKLKAPKATKRPRRQPVAGTSLTVEPPRQASNISQSTHDVKDELTTEEKDELEREMIHPDVYDPKESERMGHFFGSLQDIGKRHAAIEERKKHLEGKHPKDLTEKQRRRQERAYIKERLLPRRIQKNQDPQKYKSKVVRTELERGDGMTRHFLEFDLGWTLLDYEQSGERKLMAFTGIHATLEEPTHRPKMNRNDETSPQEDN